MIVILERNSCNPRDAISTPSMRIEPSAASIIRNRAKVKDDFPAPVLPTIPTFFPPATSKDTLLRTKSKFSLQKFYI